MTSPQTRTKGAAKAALLSLAIGSFGIGMTEFVMMGLLPQIARDLLPGTWAVSQEDAIAQAGILISMYALGVVIGAPTISGLVARFPRHKVIVGVAIALTVFNGLVVIAPSFGFVAAARLLAGLPHGVYFGFGALIAAEIMGPGKRAQGVAFVLTGLTIANVVGVPAGTLLGQQFGWRLTFVVVASIFLIATVMLAIFTPTHQGDTTRTFTAELRVFRIPQVWLTLGVGAIGFGGFFAVYSYISPVVTEVAGGPEWTVPFVLVLMGIGMTAGNILGGKLADIDLKRALFGGFALLIVSLVLLAFTAHIFGLLALFVFFVGFGSSVTSPTIQTRLMDVAEDNQSIAAALNHASLNMGNSLGAFLGGVVIAGGLGFLAPTWVGVGLALCGVVIAAVSFSLEARTARARA